MNRHKFPLLKQPFYKNKEWLHKEYWEKMKSSRKIGTECDVSVVTILYWMKKFDIKRRKNPKAKKLARLRCSCDTMLETIWYYCPVCGRKIRRIEIMKYHGKIWEFD